MKKIFASRKTSFVISTFTFLFLFLLGSTAFVSADTTNEIHYGAVSASQGQQIGITYNGPSGESDYLCDLGTGQCTQNVNDKFFVSKDDFALTSSDGKYGLRVFALSVAGSIHAYYSLYDISGSSPIFVSLLPFSQPASEKYFTKDNENLIFITSDGSVTRYNIPSRQQTSMTIPSTDLPFLTISPDGEYLSSYNYVLGSHRLYDLKKGTISEIKSSQPSYLEFGTGGYGAYKDTAGNFDALYSVDLSSPMTPKKITDSNAVIEDYTFVGSDLFYMSNEGHPLEWSIYEYDPSTANNKEIASNVSYGEYMQAQDGKLLYQKVDGTNANIFAFDPGTGDTKEFAPLGASPLSSDISRTPKLMESGRQAVVLSPKGKKNGDLFIWLHGGPMRQISVGYHSYLSYAVYDELLNRLANSGATVLKLDYTGSFGYGNDLLNGLHGKVGVADVNDVVSAVNEMKKGGNYDHVYLIGNSYGGYLTLKSLVDHPSLFDGGIAISPVTDWYGLVTRIPSSPFADLFNGTPNSSNLTAYLNASIYGGIPTLPSSKKILLEYGQQDTEVPNWQSTDFVTFANNFNVDLDTIVFPDEGHIIKKRANLDALCSKIVSDFDLSGVECHL